MTTTANQHLALTHDIKTAAQTILHYYHYCNKGIYPFTAECKDFELRTLAELDGHGIEMVQYTRQSATEQSKQPESRPPRWLYGTLLMHVSSDTERYWESLWAGDAYENEYYYLSQLYEAGWQARLMA